MKNNCVGATETTAKNYDGKNKVLSIYIHKYFFYFTKHQVVLDYLFFVIIVLFSFRFYRRTVHRRHVAYEQTNQSSSISNRSEFSYRQNSAAQTNWSNRHGSGFFPHIHTDILHMAINNFTIIFEILFFAKTFGVKCVR